MPRKKAAPKAPKEPKAEPGKSGRFGPGNKAGVGHGRPPVPPETRALRQVNKLALERVLNELLCQPRSELQRVLEAPETPALVAMAARVLEEAISKGDDGRMEYLLSRLIGKIPEAPKDIRVTLQTTPQGELLEKARAAIAYLEEARAGEVVDVEHEPK